VDDQPVFVTAEIKDDSVVAHEIDGATELPLYLGRIGPNAPWLPQRTKHEWGPRQVGDAPRILSECDARSPA
jgi:hypothetical protein